MRRFVCALAVCGTLASVESATASSIVFDFSGLVSSDVYTCPDPIQVTILAQYRRMQLDNHFLARLVFLMSTLWR
jgi:hypothetical protein